MGDNCAAKPQEPRETSTSGPGGFFAVDRRAWRMVCDEGMNAACAYLTLARGTGADNRTTSWSAKSIHQRMRIARARATEAIAATIKRGAVYLDPESSRDHPRYWLPPPHMIAGGPGASTGAQPLNPRLLHSLGYEWVHLAELETNRKRWPSASLRTDLEAMVQSCHVEKAGDCYRAIPPQPKGTDVPDWIWLPNEIVDGATAETPPVELLRETADVRLLRLLVELYADQNLAAEAGIHFRTIHQTFARVQVSARGAVVVWAFHQSDWKVDPIRATFAEHYSLSAAGKGSITPDGDFAEAWELLLKLGLVESVAHIVNTDGEEGEILAPLPIDRAGLPIEHAVAAAARQTAFGLLTKTQMQAGRNTVLAPVRRHIQQVQLVGVARLLYRPKTTMTQEFFAREKRWIELIERIQKGGGI